MLEIFGEMLKSGASGYIIITILFVWFFFTINKQQNEREDKLMSHNEKYQEILIKQSSVIQEQGRLLDRLRESVDRQTEQVGRIALIVDGVSMEAERTKRQLLELQDKYGQIS